MPEHRAIANFNHKTQPLAEPSGDLLIAAPYRWDEACFAIPAIRALLRTGWKISLLCPSHQTGLWQTLPNLPAIAVEPNESIRSLSQRIANAWRTAIVWENNNLSRAIKRAGIPRSIGPKGEKWAEWVSDPIDLTPRPKTHRVEYYLATASSLGQTARDAALFQPFATKEPVHPLLLVPDSDFGPSYEWPIDRWQELANRLHDEQRDFEIASLAGGRNLGVTLAARTKRENLVEITPSGPSIEVFSRFATLVAADGSTPHLASHAGCRCVTLFGPGDPMTHRPLGKRHAVVGRHVECSPCFLPNCPMDGRCQNELSVERVLRFLHDVDKR